jgi:hypothetical protein
MTDEFWTLLIECGRSFYFILLTYIGLSFFFCSPSLLKLNIPLVVFPIYCRAWLMASCRLDIIYIADFELVLEYGLYCCFNIYYQL